MKGLVLILSIYLSALSGFSQSRIDTLLKKMNGGVPIHGDSSLIINTKIDTDITVVEGNDQRYPKPMVVDAGEAKNYYGLRIIITDKIYGGKVIKESGRTYLYLGGNYPNQKLTISVKSNALKKPIHSIINYDITVIGKIIGDKDKPYIFVRDEDVKVLTKAKNVLMYNEMPD